MLFEMLIGEYKHHSTQCFFNRDTVLSEEFSYSKHVRSLLPPSLLSTPYLPFSITRLLVGSITEGFI